MKMKTKNQRKLISFLFFIFFLFWLQNLPAQQSGTGLLINAAAFSGGSRYDGGYVKPLTRALPLFGKGIKKSNRKNRVPLPFGAGAGMFYYNQGFFTDSLLLTSVSPVTGDTIHARPDTLIQDTRGHELRVTVKPNVWIFPFLNVYGVAGYSSGIIVPNLTVPGITVDFPGLGEVPIDTTIEITDNILISGPVYGFGATFAMGFKQFFVIADYRYSVTVPNEIDAKMVYNRFAPKVGIRIRPSKALLMEFWGGTMYFSNAQTIYGKMKVSDFSTTLAQVLGDDAEYRGTIKPIHKWNLLAGGVITLRNRQRFMVEAGFVNRTQVRLGYEFRF